MYERGTRNGVAEKQDRYPDMPGQASKSHLAFFFFSFFITIIISIFIPSFVINKNRYIVVWAAAWRQTNRQASNYSSNSSSSSNSRVVIIGSGIMCTCVACNLCSECVYMYARVFRFLHASINIARGADAKFQIYGQEFAGTPFVMLILIYVFHVKEIKKDPPLPPPIPFASLLFPLLSPKISSRAISIDSADVKCLVRARVTLRFTRCAVP